MISAKTQIVAAAAAVIALSASVSAVPTYGDYLEARGPAASKLANTAAESAAGKAASYVGRQAGKAAADIAHRKVVDAANQSIKDHIEAKKHSHGKRSLDDVFAELIARGPAASRITNTAAESAAGKAASYVGRQAGKAAADIAHRKVVDTANQAIKDHIEAKKHNHGKRSFDDVFAELMARGPAASRLANTAAESAAGKAASYVGRQAGKAAADIAHRKVVDAANQAIKDRLEEAKKNNHKKRSLAFDDEFDELVARGPAASRLANTAAESAAGKAASYVGRQAGKAAADIAHRKVVDAANQAIKDRLEEAKKNNHKKRSLAFDDEFDELVTRGPAASKLANTAAESAAGKAASYVGRQAGKAAADIAHRKVVDAANQSIKDHIEAKKHSHAKRELVAALIDYIEARAYELDDLE